LDSGCGTVVGKVCERGSILGASSRSGIEYPLLGPRKPAGRATTHPSAAQSRLETFLPTHEIYPVMEGEERCHDSGGEAATIIEPPADGTSLRPQHCGTHALISARFMHTGEVTPAAIAPFKCNTGKHWDSRSNYSLPSPTLDTIVSSLCRWDGGCICERRPHGTAQPGRGRGRGGRLV
jgi:hypothetical protein